MKKLFTILAFGWCLHMQAQIVRYSGGGGPVSSLTTQQVSVKDFGAIADGQSHPLSSVYSTLASAQAVYPTAVSLTEEIDGLAIQTTIDYVIYGNVAAGSLAVGKKAAGRDVYLPDGVYLTSRTIDVGYGDQYSSANLIGATHLSYSIGDSHFKGPVIKVQFNNAPAINVQGARASIIRGLTIIGKNNVSPGYLVGMLQLQNYIDPTLPRSASARYSPYVGISIDAYGATKPTDTTGGMVAYPDMVYPPGVANTTQWTKNRSSNVTIEKCRITNFIVGIATEPAGGDNNGDFIYMIDDQISQCPYGVCITQSQSRLTELLRCQIDYAYYAVDNNSFGSSHGRMLAIQNCHFSGYAILNILNTDYNGPIEIRDCYAESLHRIGEFGIDRTAASGISFENCHFDFNHGDINTIPLNILQIYNRCAVSFRGCTFNSYPTAIINGNGQDVIFENCKFSIRLSLYNSSGFTAQALMQEFLLYTGGIAAVKGHKIMKGCYVGAMDVLTGQTLINGIIPDGVGSDNWNAYAVNINSNAALTVTRPAGAYAYGGAVYPGPTTRGYISPATLRIPFTLNFPTGSHAAYEVEPGYVFTAWDGRIWMVTGSSTSGSIESDTAVLLNGYTWGSGAASAFTADTTSANFAPGQSNYIYPKFNRNVSTTQNALTGTVTSGTNTITNIQLYGANATIGQITAPVSSFYYLYFYTISSGGDPGSKTSGWYGPFRITAIDGTARTVTLDRNVAISGTVHLFNTCSY